MKVNPVGLWFHADFLCTSAPEHSGRWAGEQDRWALGQHLQGAHTVSRLSFGSSESFQKRLQCTGGGGSG